LRLLEQKGDPAKVTVADIVETVGCTPPTLYHYWPKRKMLLLEASAQGFAKFRQTQNVAVDKATDPLDRIRLRGQAYLDFALARPPLFRVLFLDRPLPGQAPAEVANPGRGFQDLIADVSQAMETGQLAADDPLAVAFSLWAAVHGIASLWVNNPDLPTSLVRSVAAKQSEALLVGFSPGDASKSAESSSSSGAKIN
jgi:AcrR family transcriptional regulator